MHWAGLVVCTLVGVVAYYAGYLHGTAEGRHRQKWDIPISWWRG